jgi:hypothetical protein
MQAINHAGSVAVLSKVKPASGNIRPIALRWPAFGRTD